MVSHLVGDDVGIGKVAVGTELLAHAAEERQVDVQALVGRAVERAHLRAALSAACAGRAGIEHHRWRGVGAQPLLLEDLGPHVLGAGQNLLAERCQFLLFGSELRGVGSPLLLDAASHAHRTGILQHIADVAAHEQCDESCDNQSADASDARFSAHAHASAILDIATFSSSFKIHSVIF